MATKGAPVAAGALVAAAVTPRPRRGLDSDDSKNSANTAVLLTLSADLQTIRSLPIFAGTEQAAPQEIGEKQGSFFGLLEQLLGGAVRRGHGECAEVQGRCHFCSAQHWAYHCAKPASAG